MAALTVEQFEVMMAKVPLATHLGIRTLELGEGFAALHMPFAPNMARPGNTVSGPALMTLADVALWAAVLTHIGPVEMAVTTNLSINFLRMAGPVDIIGEGRTIKAGRRLAVGTVDLLSAKDRGLVAHCTGTYALPG